ALQAGYIEGLGDKFSLDLVGDVTFFGKNDDFGPASQTLKQKPLFQAQAFLRYHVNERFDLRAGVSRLWGGETEVDGLDMNDKPNTSKFSVGASWFVTPRDQLMVNFGRDISVDNGFKEQGRVNLRLLHVF
ncbi:transporter, partial [Pseudomonas paraeruginosa]